MPPGDSASPPEVARCSSVPCRPQTPWCGWVNENAFASVVQARPIPPLADRFILGSPHRLRPGTSPQALRIPSCDGPLDGHPAFRSTASGGSRSVLAVSSFRFRARLDVSIPSTFSGQRGITPAFGYGAPHLSARGTLTLPNSVLLSTHYGAVRPCSAHRYCRPRGAPAWAFSLIITDQVLKFPTKAQDESHASYTPDIAWPVSRSLPCCSRSKPDTPVLMSSEFDFDGFRVSR